MAGTAIFLFDDDNIPLLREVFQHGPLGLAVDVDGTISEIAATPGAAVVSEECKRWLRILTKQLDLVAAISGRPAAEAGAMVGVEGLLCLGNHGLERWESGKLTVRHDARRYVRMIQQCLSEIARRLHIDGLFFENKGATATIHFRNTKQPDVAREAVLQAIGETSAAAGLKVTEGKMVIELRPPIEANKGTALKHVVAEHSLSSLFYLGDDLTDVDAFVALHELQETMGLRGVAVAVLGAETPTEVVANADLLLRGVPEVERFLACLSQEAGGDHFVRREAGPRRSQ